MDKKYYWFAGGILVLLVIFVLLRNQPVKVNGPEPSSTKPSQASQQTTAAPAAQTSPGAQTPVVNKTYGDLVNQYVDKRIQFSDTCQASPNNLVFKNGTTIMLDNRANVARTIKLNTTAYYLGAYGYKLVTLSYSGLPKVVLVDCGSSQNVATITVQK